MCILKTNLINLTPPPKKKKAQLPMYSKLPCEFTLFTKIAETTLGLNAPEYTTHPGF